MPPQPIQDFANAVKQEFADRFASRGAQKSPPHITLQPPFEWLVQEIATLEQALSQFAQTSSSVPVTLSGFAAFPPRVIFINVLKTPELLTLQQTLMAQVETSLGIVDAVGKTRPFAPHMTVAFRDLTKPNFRAAWAEFQGRSLQVAGEELAQVTFLASHITLLIHNGQRWNIHRGFPLASE